MIKLLLPALLLGAGLTTLQTTKPVVLKGFDPVQLVTGKEVAGKTNLSADYGRFRYLFATEEDKTAFTKSPEKFAVQLNGNCIMSPSMPGDPNLYTVYNGKIYLGGSKSCIEMVKGHEEQAIKDNENTKKVAIMIFPGVQIIDYTGPYEVLGEAGYDVFTVAAKPEPLTTNMGMVVTPNYTFDNCPKFDILVCPGGNVPQTAEANDAQVAFVKKMSGQTTYTMSVCNGAFWLANAGLLDGKKATTFYGMLEDLKTKYPKVDVIRDAKFADNGNIVCTAGLSSGIEGALHMVEKIDGAGAAKSIALNMEYDWRPDSGFARGSFADMYLRRAIGRGGFTLPENTDVQTVDVSGDKNHWDKSWALSGKDLDQHSLMQGIQKQLSATWTLVNSETDGVDKTTWKFKGDDGADWTAETIIKPGDAGKFVLTVHLQKA